MEPSEGSTVKVGDWGLVMLTLLIYLLIGLIICSIVWWVINQLSLPQPVRMVAVVIMAIIGIVFLLQLVGGVGGIGHLSLR